MSENTGKGAALLLLSFTAVAASFVGVSIYSQHRVALIDDAAAHIIQNGPRVEQLAAARGALRHLEDLRHREELETTIRAAISATAEPSRARLVEELKRAHAQLLSALEGAGPTGVSAEVSRAADRLDAALVRLLDDVEDGSRRLAVGIERLRRHTMWVAFLLDGIALAFTLVAALFVFGSFRRYRAAVDDHHAFLMRRGDELEQFSSRVAHDILSPLAAASMALSVAHKRLAGDSAGAMIARGQSGLKRVQRVVDGLLGFARAGAAPEMGAQANLEEVVRDVVAGLSPVAEETHATIRLEVSAAPSVACTPGVLTSLVSNLVGNSLKYLGNAANREIAVRIDEAGGAAHVEVEDHGPGLPEGTDVEIWQPYVRKSHSTPGLGLGLATVKRIVEGHHGRVGVRSRPNEGCIFWFDLPKTEATKNLVPGR